jgi:hypothetical protein
MNKSSQCALHILFTPEHFKKREPPVFSRSVLISFVRIYFWVIKLMVKNKLSGTGYAGTGKCPFAEGEND